MNEFRDFRDLKGGNGNENVFSPLSGANEPRRVGPSVSYSSNAVQNWSRWVSCQDKVAVKRVDAKRFGNCLLRGGESETDDLAAKDPSSVCRFPKPFAPKEIHIDFCILRE